MKCQRHIMIVKDGKWKDHKCIIESKTKKGFYVYLIDVKLTTLERLVFGTDNKVYGVSPKYKRAYVQNLQKTNDTLCFDFDDSSSERLLNKWFGYKRPNSGLISRKL